MEIITLTKTDYKEKDVIISAISKDGPVSFKVRGANSPTSHFNFVNNPLTLLEAEYVENVRYRHQILKGAKLLATPYAKDMSYIRVLCGQFVVEMMEKMFFTEESHKMYEHLKGYINYVKDIGEDDILLPTLVLFAKAVQSSGGTLEVEQCVTCGTKKDVVGFSFKEGGFLCRNCWKESELAESDLSLPQMKLIRYIFRVTDFASLPKGKLNKEDGLTLMKKLGEFVSDYTGVTLNSIQLILKS